MQNQNLLSLSIQDFFTKDILKIAFLPFVITIILMYILFFVAADMGLDTLKESISQESTLEIQSSSQTISNGVPHTETTHEIYQGSSIINFLLSHAITSWIVTFLLYTLGSFVILLLSIIVSLIIIGFLTPPILKIIQKRHYSDVEIIGFGNIGSVILYFVKSFLMTLLILFLFIPLFFIPLVNVVAFNFPFYYLFHKLLTFDVGSTIATRWEDKQIRFETATELRSKTLFLYLISLIPFAVLFLSAFYVVYIGHTYFYELRRVRKLSGVE